MLLLCSNIATSPLEFCQNYGLFWPPDGPILFQVLGGFSLISCLVVVLQLVVGHIPSSFRQWMSTLPILVHHVGICFTRWLSVFQIVFVLDPPAAIQRLWAFSKYFFLGEHEHHLSVHLSIALSSDTSVKEERQVSWEPDSVQAVINNCANTHVWTKQEDFLP